MKILITSSARGLHIDGGCSSVFSAPLGGVLTVIAGVLLHVCLGTVYTFGATGNYFISYIRASAPNSDLRMGSAAAFMAAEFSAMAIAMPVGGQLERIIGARLTMLLGGGLVVLSVAMTRFCLESFAAFVGMYAVCYGIGLGIAYTSPLVCALRWFPNHKGLISGFITAGFGSGAAIFAPFQTYLMNPHNLSPASVPYPEYPNEVYFVDPLVLNNVPGLFRTLAFAYAAIVVVACVLVQPQPPAPAHGAGGARGLAGGRQGITADNLGQPTPEIARLRAAAGVPQEEFASAVGEGALRAQDAPGELKVVDALRTSQFWILFTVFMMHGICIVFYSTFWKGLGVPTPTKPGLSEGQLAAVAAAASASNALGRILWGRVADATSFHAALGLLSLSWCLCFLCLPFACECSGILYAIFTCLSFVCLGGNFSLFPAGVSEVYGHAALGRIYGFVFLAQVVSSIFVGMLGQPIIQAFGVYGAVNGLSVVCACTAAALHYLKVQQYDWNFKPKA